MTGKNKQKGYIDIHIHPFAEGEKGRGSFISESLKKSLFMKAARFFYLDDERIAGGRYTEFSLKGLPQIIEESGLKKAVVLAMDGIYTDGTLDRDRTSLYISNDFVRALSQRNDKLLFGASVNPKRRDREDELERVKENGAVLVKIIPNTQDIDLSNKKFLPYYRKLVELDLPLLVHTGYEHATGVTDQSLGHPDKLKTPLEEGVTVIAGHSGTGGFLCFSGSELIGFRETFQDFLKLLNEYPNLYGDISAFGSPARGAYVKRVLGDGFPTGRLINGSDFPIPVTPWYFWKDLTFKQIRKLQDIDNYFDRDIELKKALGFSDSLLKRGEEIFDF